MLEVNDLNAYYGKSHILRGVNLKIENGEIVSLLGRNGVGRSTTCKAIMGEVEPIGSVKFNGTELAGKKAFEVANAGLGYVPENAWTFSEILWESVTSRLLTELTVVLSCCIAHGTFALSQSFAIARG